MRNKKSPLVFLSMFFLVVLVSNGRAAAIDLGGEWIEQETGAKCVITQTGVALAFSNYGGSGDGQVSGTAKIVTSGWGGGSGTIVNNGNTIKWANNYTWNRAGSGVHEPAAIDLSGEWIEQETGAKCVITQTGVALAFSNYGGSGEGQVSGAAKIVTTGWGGGSGAIVNNGNTIKWANNYSWNRN